MFALLAIAAAQAAQPAPAAPLAPMAFLVGHCWQGTFQNGARDTHCFEAVYGGRFVRDRHEVTGGYAGETLYSWNAAEGRADYVYWNSSGGVSRGTMRPDGDVLDFGDELYRAPDGSETRIATRWYRIDADSYEARITSSADPTGSRVVRYVRTDAAPVAMSEVRAPDGSATLTHEIVIPAPPEQVYHAVASAEGWRGWAVRHAWPVPSDDDLMETSYQPDALLGDPANIQQRFLARVPGRLVVFRTVRTPPGFPHADAYVRTTSIFELIPEVGGTRVRLTGTGYPPGPAGDQLLAFFRDGNRVSLEALRRHLEGTAAR